MMKFTQKDFSGNKFCLFNSATQETGRYGGIEWLKTSTLGLHSLDQNDEENSLDIGITFGSAFIDTK